MTPESKALDAFLSACMDGGMSGQAMGAAMRSKFSELAKPPTQPVQPECWCTRCDLEVNTFRSHMAICPLCGDKRCPRAKDHRDDCANPKAASAEAKALPEDTK